ncbi:MAG TPA: glycosyltransferase family 87 protein [Candidatus Baltobacteraceae bacterium]
MTPATGPRWVAAIAGTLFLIVFLAVPTARPGSLLRDFNAFYCAGATVLDHQDPYLNEPLGTCERNAPRAAFLEHAPAYMTVPAPLPGYALAPFAVLALLPYDSAALVWTALLVLAFAFTVSCLREMTSLPGTTVVAALALSDGYVGLTLGQIAPIAIAAMVGTAYALRRGRMTTASVCAALAMLEPHIGVPTCIALAAARPKSLLPLGVLALALGGVSLVLLGAQANVEYFARVLPAHALAEIDNVKQLSLAYLLHGAGVEASTALRMGDGMYLAAIAAGAVMARRLPDNGRDNALLIFLPVALGTAFAPFLHIVQVAAVIPAALVLFARQRDDRLRALTVMLLAVPWPQFASLGTAFPLLAAADVGLLASGFLSATGVLVAATLALLAAAAPTYVITPVNDPTVVLLPAYDPHALAQTSWGAYIGLVGTQDAPAYTLARIPTWSGLALLCAGTARALRLSRTRRERPPS